METTTRHPIAEAMIAFINGEQSLYSMHDQETEENKQLAQIIYRLCCNWSEARRRVISSTETTIKHTKELQEQLASGYRSDKATWVASSVAELQRYADKEEMFGSHLVSLAQMIGLGNENTIRLFGILGDKASIKELLI
jgi:hypothetical protein